MNLFACFIFLQMHKFVASERIVDTILILREIIYLDCVYSGEGIITQSSWFKETGSTKEKICVLDARHGSHITEKYKDRITFVNHSSLSRDRSVTIFEISEADTGFYMCYINVFPQGTMKKVIAVQKDDFEKIVPSSNCEFVEHMNVTMSFKHTSEAVAKRVALEKFGDDKLDIIASCNDFTEPRYSFDYRDRMFVDCSNIHNIILFIPNITKTDKGLYKCIFYTDEGNHTIVIDLYQNEDMTSRFLNPIIYGGSATITVIIISIITVLYIKKRKQKLKGRKMESSRQNAKYKPGNGKFAVVDETEHIYANSAPNTEMIR